VNGESALNRILQPGGITPVYQPVVRVDNDTVRMYGLECLSRGPKGSNFESADVLFEYVRLKREESVVDRACISEALRGARLLPSDLRLGVNVHASTLGRDHGFINFMRKTTDAAQIDISRVTIEIVEHAPPWDSVSFLSAIEQLRRLGAEIAVDDRRCRDRDHPLDLCAPRADAVPLRRQRAPFHRVLGHRRRRRLGYA
jgi:EAL domain-containing protein (putative c-di-GMP-specific phosphodiesterase class I)